MDRRGFLGRLAAGFGAAVFAPSDLLWKPIHTDVLVTPEAIVGFEQIVREFARRLDQRLALGPVPLLEGHLLGHEESGLQLTDAHFVVFRRDDVPAVVDRYGLDADRHLEPLVALLTNSLRQKPIKAFGKCLIPRCVDQAVRVDLPSGLSVRGVRAYDVGEDWMPMRFDVVVAS